MVTFRRTATFLAAATGIGAAAVLGVTAQSASAAPLSLPRATASSSVPSRVLNCGYTVTEKTVLVTPDGQLPLEEGDILYGPRAAPGSSAWLYSYYWAKSGYVWTGALHEEYCE
jgi:hypothetical protein